MKKTVISFSLSPKVADMIREINQLSGSEREKSRIVDGILERNLPDVLARLQNDSSDHTAAILPASMYSYREDEIQRVLISLLKSYGVIPDNSSRPSEENALKIDVGHVNVDPGESPLPSEQDREKVDELRKLAEGSIRSMIGSRNPGRSERL